MAQHDESHKLDNIVNLISTSDSIKKLLMCLDLFRFVHHYIMEPISDAVFSRISILANAQAKSNETRISITATPFESNKDLSNFRVGEFFEELAYSLPTNASVKVLNALDGSLCWGAEVDYRVSSEQCDFIGAPLYISESCLLYPIEEYIRHYASSSLIINISHGLPSDIANILSKNSMVIHADKLTSLDKLNIKNSFAISKIMKMTPDIQKKYLSYLSEKQKRFMLLSSLSLGVVDIAKAVLESITIPNKEGNTLMFLTDAPGGTLGDVANASKMLRFFLRKYADDSNVKVVWVIRESNGQIKAQDLIPEGLDDLFIIKEWSQILNIPIVISKLLSSSVSIVSYPTPDYIPYKLLSALSIFHPKVVNIGEYDFKWENELNVSHKGIGYIRTGFSGNGVFIEDKIPSAELKGNGSYLNSIKDADIYFSYHNTQTSERVSNYSVANLLVFSITALQKSLAKEIRPSKVIVVAKASDEDFTSIVNYIKEVGVGDIATLTFNSPQKTLSTSIGESGVDIVIENIFPLRNSEIIRLLELSEPFCMLTGDASFLEGISLGKIILYQRMSWKSKFFDSFKEDLKNCTKVPQELLDWVDLQSIYRGSTTINISEAKTMIESSFNMILNHEAKLLSGMELYRKHVLKNKNIKLRIEQECKHHLTSPLPSKNYNYGIIPFLRNFKTENYTIELKSKESCLMNRDEMSNSESRIYKPGYGPGAMVVYKRSAFKVT